MPVITVGLFNDRTLEQRRALARAFTQASQEILGVAPDKVRITFHELERSDVAIGGVLISDRDMPAPDAAEEGL